MDDYVGASEAVIEIYYKKELKEKMISLGMEDVQKKFNVRRVSEEHGEMFEKLLKL